MKVLLEGRPRAGKTTVALRFAELVPRARGFVTRELREGGRRLGFEVEALGSGDRAVLAHVDLSGPPRVGKYGVDVDAFERIALPALHAVRAGHVAVVDEVGKMELASEPFRDAFSRLVDRRVHLVATVHVFRHPYTDALKRRDDVDVIPVTRANRDELPELLLERLGG
jgi:nucleoside-triphosphatase